MIAANPTPATSARAELLARYRRVRAQTESLSSTLTAEDQAVQTMADMSPTKWHRAHTTWFFETFVLAPYCAGYEVFHPRFGFLFNSYYNAVGPMHLRARRGDLTRPGLDQIVRYRAHVDRAIEGLLAGPAGAALGAAAWGEIEARIRLGTHHEQQHQELLLTDILHAFSRNPLRPAFRPPGMSPDTVAAALGWVPFEEGLREIGRPDGGGFCFDNETPRHRVFLEAFELATRPVTNREFLAFIEDGGYQTAALWLSDGWATANAAQWRAPMYWERRDGAWWQMTLGGMRPIDLEAPVDHVSYYEADAYAAWAGARLPSEAEWEVAIAPAAGGGHFVEDGYFRPVAASASAADRPYQMMGDVWEWTSSPYVAYPRYRPAPGAIGEYNGKFMCDQWVLRGGSCATPRDHVRSTYRNFFPAGVRWQFSGFRLARDPA